MTSIRKIKKKRMELKYFEYKEGVGKKSLLMRGIGNELEKDMGNGIVKVALDKIRKNTKSSVNKKWKWILAMQMHNVQDITKKYGKSLQKVIKVPILGKWIDRVKPIQ